MTLLNNAGWPAFVLLFVLAMVTLYVAREPAHRALNALFSGVAHALRLLSRTFLRSAASMRKRNREVLLNLGREHEARELNKEFHEISQFVQRDLGGYPELQQQMRDQIHAIQSAHEDSQLAATSLPEWQDAVESLAKLKNDPASANSSVLEQIHSTAISQHKDNLKAFNEANAKRYKGLQRILPYWRRLSFSIDQAGDKLSDITKRSEKIDAHMARYEEIEQGSDKALRFLSASALTQCVISALVVAIAIGGAFFNFHLIALPMSEMVGSVQRIGGVKVSDLAALVIICMEISAGVFLLESLRITKLFPMIGSMDNRTRRVIMATSLGVLVTLACTESALAFMRDQIAHDLAVLRASLSGTTVDPALAQQGAQHWIPLAANMVLGFVLPIALTMIAIPLEYLLQSARTVFGNVLAYLMSCIGVALRLTGDLVRQLGRATVSCYDLLIAGPLFIETLVQKGNKREKEARTSNGDWHIQPELAATHPDRGNSHLEFEEAEPEGLQKGKLKTKRGRRS